MHTQTRPWKSMITHTLFRQIPFPFIVTNSYCDHFDAWLESIYTDISNAKTPERGEIYFFSQAIDKVLATPALNKSTGNTSHQSTEQY